MHILESVLVVRTGLRMGWAFKNCPTLVITLGSSLLKFKKNERTTGSGF
jgi:hypothetical protein